MSESDRQNLLTESKKLAQEILGMDKDELAEAVGELCIEVIILRSYRDSREQAA